MERSSPLVESVVEGSCSFTWERRELKASKVVSWREVVVVVEVRR